MRICSKNISFNVSFDVFFNISFIRNQLAVFVFSFDDVSPTVGQDSAFEKQTCAIRFLLKCFSEIGLEEIQEEIRHQVNFRAHLCVYLHGI